MTRGTGSSADARANTDDDVDAPDFSSGRRRRQAADRQVMRRDILQLAARLAEEVMMISGVGVEIGTAWFDDRLAQQSNLGKLMQRVVHGRERYWNPGGLRLAMQLFRSHVSIATFKKEAGERQALASRPQSGGAQASECG
jgi:hypothetical protein